MMRMPVEIWLTTGNRVNSRLAAMDTATSPANTFCFLAGGTITAINMP